MRILSLFIFLSLFLSACGGGNANVESTEATADTTAAAAPVMKYTLTPFSQSVDFPDAKIDDVTFKSGKFNFKISNYQLGLQTSDAPQKMCANSADGQHIHVIIDTLPYSAQYKPQFDYQITDGEHYFLAFLSRSYHESIKHPGAAVARKVMVKGNSFTSMEDITQPMLFYSRPKGAYVGAGETAKVMLDFYLVNAQLGDQYQVKADINGETHMIDTWQPYYIEGLPIGENTITLTLVDAAGNPVQTPLNPVTRKFELKEDPAPAQ